MNTIARKTVYPDTRKWTGRWIGTGRKMCAPSKTVVPSPWFRKSFDWCPDGKPVTAFLCGLGWHELYVNGRKADSRVLTPTVSLYEKRVGYLEYDLTPLLQAGRNCVVVWLGNGWYNCHATSTWTLDTAPWRDWPKLLCDIVVGDQVIAASDESWRWHESPITFDSLLNGEKYDARKEIAGFADPFFDDRDWSYAVYAMPTGGIPVLEDALPCEVCRSYAPVEVRQISGNEYTFDFGTNLTGWCELEVSGNPGDELQLTYAERVRDNGAIDQTEIAGALLKPGEKFQMDYYFCRGGGVEKYHPRFTYHGFRYVRIQFWSEQVEIHRIEARFVHSALPEAGQFSYSSPVLNQLQKMTRQSYLSNFTGIPTDCPHREKLGWTNDAQLAAETGLWNFDGLESYRHFLRMASDAQRACGQLPAVVPSGGWGFNEFSGPINDNIFFEICWNAYLFRGETGMIEEFYDTMALLLEYYASMARNQLIPFGLGDWAPWSCFDLGPSELTSSGYYDQMLCRMVRFAHLLGRAEDAVHYQRTAGLVRHAFQEKYHAGYLPEHGTLTALAAMLYFDLAIDSEATFAELLERIRRVEHKAFFGILGAKFIPRVLAEGGAVDDAYRILTQEQCPGWGYWVKCGATTLWEQWNGTASRNHIMFGDVSAWCYRYLGGIAPQWDGAGFQQFQLKPCFPNSLTSFQAEYRSCRGRIRSEWKRCGSRIECRFEVPDTSVAELSLPGRDLTMLSGGIHEFTVVEES